MSYRPASTAEGRLDVSITRSANALVLSLSAAIVAASLAPASAPASALTREERAHRREERAQEREQRAHERAQEREQRTHEREARTHEREQRAREREQRAHESEEHTAPRAVRGCRLTAHVSTRHITAGEDVSVFGKLLCRQAAGAGERLVTIYRGHRGATGSVAGTVTTEADGSYRLQIASLEANALLLVRAEHARGTRVVVKVAPRVNLARPESTPDVAGAYAGATFTGTAGAAYAGAPVALQSSFAPTTEQWKTIAYGRVDAQGTFSITRGFRRPGERWIRAVVGLVGGYVPGASEAVAYDVLGRQNPALTVESSAPVVSYGQTVTIGGTSAQGAGQPVTLLARTTRGGFHQVLTATTGEGGRYSFTQQPLQRTWYEVREGSTRSNPLMQDVAVTLTPTTPPASIEAGQQVTFTGSLAPATTGERVALELENASGVGFHVIAGAPVEDGGYAIPYTFLSAANHTLRIATEAAPGLEPTASTPFTLQVTPPASGASLLAL